MASTTELKVPSLKKADLYSNGKTKVIKTALYRFEVSDIKKSTGAIETAILKYPAYIGSSSLLLEKDHHENKMSIRVQDEYFHELLEDIDNEAISVNSEILLLMMSRKNLLILNHA